MILTATAVLLLLGNFLAASDPDVAAIERWDRIVCLVTDKPSAPVVSGNENLSSGFVIATPNGFVLVTASHAAKQTTPDTKVGIRLQNGVASGLYIKDLTRQGNDPWEYHPTSDVAVLRIATQRLESSVAVRLNLIAMQIDSLEPAVPMRTTAIEITGFPMKLGADSISPIAMKGFLASRELQVKSIWGAEPILLAVPIVGAGTSGGAVFRATDEPVGTSLVGMYIGMMFDDTGVKLAKIVPSYVIRNFIESGASKAK